MSYAASAFLLTGETIDVTAGRMGFRYFGRSPELGPIEILITDIPGIVFSGDLESSDGLPDYDQKSSPLKKVNGENLNAYTFKTRNAQHALMNAFKEKGQEAFETDIKHHERFLMELGIRGGIWLEGDAKVKDGRAVFKNPRIKPYEVKTDFRIASIDIENGVNIDSLFSIAIHMKGCGPERKKVLMLDDHSHEMNDFTTCFNTETDLLNAFMDYIAAEDPDIIIGWNVIGYDLAQLQKYCERNYLDFKLDRLGKEPDIFSPMMGVSFAFMSGRVVIEGMSAIRDMGYTFKNNRLETVAVELLGEGKLIHDEDDKLAEIERQFLEEKENLAKYNLQDVELVTRLFEKIGVVEFMATRTCLSGVMFSQLEINNAILENLWIPEIHKGGFVALGDGEKKTSRNDAYRYLASEAGVHDNVVQLRIPQITAWLASLFDIDPYSLAQAENGEELPWGAKRLKDQAFIAKELKKLLTYRSQFKDCDWQCRAVNHTLKQCMEESLKSANRFFTPTYKGAIMQACAWLTEEINQGLLAVSAKLVASNDTSLYVSVEEYSELDVETHLNQCIQNACSDLGLEAVVPLCEKIAIFEKILFIKRNNDNFLRYAYLCEEGEVKITGLYNTGPRWTQLAHYFQEELMKQILTGKDWQVWIREFTESVRDGAHRDKISYFRKVKQSDLLEKKDQAQVVALLKYLDYYKPTAPVNVISYIMTLDDGPVPSVLNPRTPDIEHYIESQLARVANPYLALVGKTFEELFHAEQLSLFEF
ncbi:DNA polymerase II [Lentisphaera araneosa HTCC2155]|uniref:DNA-directed DNA polymerase n=1 Tax=Lentisphaera araneosa HTCC2155 TaxID=313628 RepID=A6DRA9_9BACT|nr:3'-5' exonuclease [Lentisphaera araneosa]EDM25856.1 DNA polymerase II [Lentisphaera araneosa HTCC2155]